MDTRCCTQLPKIVRRVVEASLQLNTTHGGEQLQWRRMSGSGSRPPTARRYENSAAANPPANPVQGISHLKPLPQSWRKKKKGSAAAAPTTAAKTEHDLDPVGLVSPMTQIRECQQPAVHTVVPVQLPISGAPPTPASAHDAMSANNQSQALVAPSPHAAVSASELGAGIGGTAVPTQAGSGLILSSPKSSHSIKPYMPATNTPPAARSPAGVTFSDDLRAVSISSSSQPVHGYQTFTNSLSLIIEALSFNQMSLDGGFDAFDADGDGRISKQDFQRSVEDLQLELDGHTIHLMHRCLDADDDGYIGKQVRNILRSVRRS